MRRADRRSEHRPGTGAFALLAASVVALAGCGEDSADPPQPPAPEAVVSAAAAETLAEPSTRVELHAPGSKDPDFAFAGLFDLGDGGFQISLTSDKEGLSHTSRLVSKSGRGPVYDLVTRTGPFTELPQPIEDPCWFSNPYPAAAKQGLSMEEGALLAGSVIESLDSETSSATEVEPGIFEVELKASAAKPSSKGKQRTWGSRPLLADVDGPITVTLADGQVTSIEMELDGYTAQYTPGLYVPADDADRKLDDIDFEATFQPGKRELRIEDPNCWMMT